MEIVKLSEVSLHQLTETHPIMNAEQFAALVKDIEENGQLQPVLVYRGKIVDGRHRYRALSQLDKDEIKIERLSNNMKLDEVAKLVESTEMRRHQSPTQLAIKGYRLYKEGNLTQAAVTGRVGCSLANLKHVISLESYGRMDLIELLENGGKMDISRDPRYSKLSDSLLAIVTWIKEEKARIEGLQAEADLDSEENRMRLDKAESSQLQAVNLITANWSNEQKKILIAQLYKSMEK